MRFISRFVMVFGLLSSLFDMLTFAALLAVFHAIPATFRTGWFVESLLTELVIALVVRTRGPFFKSRPGTMLLWSTAILIVVTLSMPYLPLVHYLGFVPIPAAMVGVLIAITLLYVVATESAKRVLFRWAGASRS